MGAGTALGWVATPYVGSICIWAYVSTRVSDIIYLIRERGHTQERKRGKTMMDWMWYLQGACKGEDSV